MLHARVLFLILFVCAGLSSLPAAHANYGADERVVLASDRAAQMELSERPVRDLSADAEVLSYLERHPVYVSLTTSPKRISQIDHVIATLDLSHVAEVLIVLPLTFGRNGESYEIPEALLKNPKVRILRIEKDLGPITKMLPAIEFAREIDPEALVISVDDDIGYAAGMVNEMIFRLVHSRKTVFSGSVPVVSGWRVPIELWPFTEADGAKIVEGWAAIGYRAGEIETRLMRRYAGLSRATYASDDVVISYVLGQTGVRKERIAGEYYHSDWNRLFAYGFQEDALHRGAGLEQKPEGLGDYNPLKYLRSVIEMNSDRQEGRRAGAVSCASSFAP